VAAEKLIQTVNSLPVGYAFGCMVHALRFLAALLAWLRSSQARREAEILLPAAATHCPEAVGAGPTQAEGHRSFDLRLPLPALPFPDRRIDRLPARDPATLASTWLSPVLALEVAAAGRSPCPIGQRPKSRSTDQSREPAVGRAAYPW
jgi:hypothetical protein